MCYCPHPRDVFCSLLQTIDDLPALPGNARYWATAPPDCVYGLGVLGEALKADKVDRQKHQFFLLMGSYVRGPFLPAFAEVSSQLALSVRLHDVISLPLVIRLSLADRKV